MVMINYSMVKRFLFFCWVIAISGCYSSIVTLTSVPYINGKPINKANFSLENFEFAILINNKVVISREDVVVVPTGKVEFTNLDGRSIADLSIYFGIKPKFKILNWDNEKIFVVYEGEKYFPTDIDVRDYAWISSCSEIELEKNIVNLEKDRWYCFEYRFKDLKILPSENFNLNLESAIAESKNNNAGIEKIKFGKFKRESEIHN